MTYIAVLRSPYLMSTMVFQIVCMEETMQVLFRDIVNYFSNVDCPPFGRMLVPGCRRHARGTLGAVCCSTSHQEELLIAETAVPSRGPARNCRRIWWEDPTGFGIYQSWSWYDIVVCGKERMIKCCLKAAYRAQRGRCARPAWAACLA